MKTIRRGKEYPARFRWVSGRTLSWSESFSRMKARYAANMKRDKLTYKQIGKILGNSPERARQIVLKGYLLQKADLRRDSLRKLIFHR